jgi:prolyl-tRNA synthetase
MKNKAITSRDVDFAKWYDDIVRAARLATYSSVKGCIIIEPNGYAIWENIQKVLDAEFKKLGHQNLYMPLFIPEGLLKKEEEHVEGFAPEVAWVTHGGKNLLEEKMCVRPTSETLFSEYYSNVIKSYRDLPMLYNQWCNVVRWEKETRPFLRSREFLWQEGHTMHETAQDAESETLQMLNVYKDFFYNYLAIPVIVGQKTEREKFAGAEYTYTVEAMMYNGISLQSGTSHYFGQKFSKPFEVKFSNRNNELEYAYQTSWGVSTRMIGGLIMVHSDDNGLVLPPKIAPRKVVIIPIGTSEDVVSKANEINNALNDNSITSFIDNSEKSPGFKFAEYETIGIPIRIELGPKDLENNNLILARRDTSEKVNVSLDCDLIKVVNGLMEDVQNHLLKKATERRDSRTYTATSLDEVKEIMENRPGFVKAMWCGNEECELMIKEIKGTKSRCIPFEQEKISDKCICCGKEAKHMVYWGIQY